MDKKELKRINMYILLVVLAMFAIPCVYYLVNKICFVCTIDNGIQSISKGLESENREKLEKSYEKDYIVNSEGTYKKSDIKKDEILEKVSTSELIEHIYDNNLLKEDSSNIVIARVSDIKGIVSTYNENIEGKEKTLVSIDTKANLEILGQLKGSIKEKNISIISKKNGVVSKEEYQKVTKDKEVELEDNPKYKYVEEKDSEQKVFLEEGKVYLFFLKYDNNEKVYDIGYPDACIREIKSISKRKLVEGIEKYNGNGKMSDEIEVRTIKEEGYEKLNSIF